MYLTYLYIYGLILCIFGLVLKTIILIGSYGVEIIFYTLLL